MRKLLLFLTLFVAACDQDDATDQPAIPTDEVFPSIPALPEPDHIIFVWFENKDYNQVIGSREARFINSLVHEGTLFSHFYAFGHPSYPQYISFFSGTTNGKNNDDCIDGRLYTNENLYTALAEKGKTFAWYSEDLPREGDRICYSGKYVERHNPTQCFSNVPDNRNKRWADFPDDYNMLEQVVCISPNLTNDMHDGSISQGDNWLQQNCASLINWCKTHNSVFVVYFDENSNQPGNHIPVIAVGEPVKVNFTDSTHYDHYNWTRTLLSMYGAAPIANSATRDDITTCWKQ